ncbi:hypothetical protein Q2941_30700 [Bradyrhizobium sp. UFLA05-153]
MKIVGVDSLIFGVDDVAGSARLLTDYGLTPMQSSESGGRFEAIDSTSVVIAHESDASLPAPPSLGCRLRKTMMGVANTATLEAIAAEFCRDRDVHYLDDGSIESIDDANFAIGFQVSVRREFVLQGEFSNAPERTCSGRSIALVFCHQPPLSARERCRTSHTSYLTS